MKAGGLSFLRIVEPPLDYVRELHRADRTLDVLVIVLGAATTLALGAVLMRAAVRGLFR
jgi:hypothetical protein